MSKGDEFPNIIHISLAIDDFIADKSKTKQALKQINTALLLVKATRNDSIILACNTAHLMQEDIEKTVGIRLKSLLTASQNRISELGTKKVGLLASPTTINCRLLHDLLEPLGVTIVTPTTYKVDTLGLVLQRVIGMQTSRKDQVFLDKLIADMENRGAEAIILGCTELSTLEFESAIPLIDPLHEISMSVLEETYNGGSHVIRS